MGTLAAYLKAVIGHTIVLLAGVVGVILLVISLAAPGAARIAGAALVVAALVLGMFLAWRDMRGEKDAARTERDRVQAEADAESARKRRLQEARDIEGETFHIWELIPEGGPSVIQHKTIRRCTILGPAVLLSHVYALFQFNDVDGAGRYPFWFMESPPHEDVPRSGVIEIFNVRITESTLVDIGMIATREQARSWNTGVPVPPPDWARQVEEARTVREPPDDPVGTSEENRP